jgi:hypothetical protein
MSKLEKLILEESLLLLMGACVVVDPAFLKQLTTVAKLIAFQKATIMCITCITLSFSPLFSMAALLSELVTSCVQSSKSVSHPYQGGYSLFITAGRNTSFTFLCCVWWMGRVLIHKEQHFPV